MSSCKIKPVILGALLLSILGCTGLQRHEDVEVADGVIEEENIEPIVYLPKSEIPSDEVLRELAKPYQAPLGDVALDDHPLVDSWINYFKGRGRGHMEKYLERSSRYLPMMKLVLREYGLPETLVYVALIESGFSPKAHSRANAVGYWQFIRATGKRYGLRQDPYIDERRDPIQSTRAAAEYFKELYGMFNNWHLAMAAYNCGENRVKRKTRQYATQDFWHLVKRRALPRETLNYVPKMIAAAKIASEPEKYGFTNIEYAPPLNYQTVALANPLSLKKWSELMGVDVEEMKMLNPKFRGDYVPMYDGAETVLRVPLGSKEVAPQHMAAALVANPPKVQAGYFYYRVRRGDTLSHIAARNRTSIAKIRSLNGLGGRSFLRVGQRLRVPDGAGYKQYYTSQNAAAPVKSEPIAQNTENQRQLGSSEVKESSYHVVRRGENLSLIARRYRVPLEDLKRLNNLSNRSILRVGQKIQVREVEEHQSANGATHKVRRGEHLTLIAQKYRTSVADLARLNGLKRNGVLFVGQVLKVDKQLVKHRVRRGETLLQIAQKYQVSPGQIVRFNDLKDRSRILAGQALLIPRED